MEIFDQLGRFGELPVGVTEIASVQVTPDLVSMLLGEEVEYYHFEDDDTNPFEVVGYDPIALYLTGSRNYSSSKDYTHLYRLPVGEDKVLKALGMLITHSFAEGVVSGRDSVKQKLTDALERLLN